MGIRFVINFVLLALPIGVTLGILMGLQASRSASGKGNLFTPDPDNGSGGSSGGGGRKRPGNGIVTDTYCQKTLGVTPYTEGEQFTLNPNQWGWNSSMPGALCMNITTYNNGSYATDYTAPRWSITWQYDQGNVDLPVHAYPNVMVEDKNFPEKLSSISGINVEHEWTYGEGDSVATDTVETDLTSSTVNLNANIAMDLFMDSDKSKAGSSEDASHEVMVWFAAIGAATQPLGMTIANVKQTPLATKTLNSTEFSLYSDKNEKGQQVLTWLATDITDSFHGDIWPLVDYLLTTDNSTFPTKDYYLGYLSWGSEAYYSATNVTLNVRQLSIEVEKSS